MQPAAQPTDWSFNSLRLDFVLKSGRKTFLSFVRECVKYNPGLKGQSFIDSGPLTEDILVSQVQNWFLL